MKDWVALGYRILQRAQAEALYRLAAVELELVDSRLDELDAGLVAVALAEGDELPDGLRDAPGADDAKGEPKAATLLYPGTPRRVLAVGVGERSDLDAERLRVAAAVAGKRAASLGARTLAWWLPDGSGPEHAAALVEGTVLTSYRFDRYRSQGSEDSPAGQVERLVLAGPGADAARIEPEASAALIVASAANRARGLQDLPANELDPAALAARATELAAAHDAVEVEVLDRAAIAGRGMGGLAAVSAGSAVEPRLITLRYAGGGGGERIGLVGKSVTFDSGGISIKPAARMHEMKMDMSGGAAVLETVAAIAELGLELDLVAVLPATENMPSGAAMRPGDIITQLNGKTVEVTNTDAEGRLILADALTYCVRDLGAARIVDVATLTGAVVVALGSTHAALISNDDEWAAAVERAAERSGELAWRLPLHPEHRRLIEGKAADLVNSSAKRKASTISAAAFLEHFVDGVPWAHLDIAGTAWDTGREYVGDGASGFGVRLLTRLARDLARG
ncbi:MAG: leucyl aminopeptidase [Solirubrobacterales bacterium]|nr:leucyl aminopeptidase [Solirubrobacterales bacterium]